MTDRDVTQPPLAGSIDSTPAHDVASFALAEHPRADCPQPRQEPATVGSRPVASSRATGDSHEPMPDRSTTTPTRNPSWRAMRTIDDTPALVLADE